MTLWPAAGLLLLAAAMNALGMLSRRRAWKVVFFLASAAAGAGAFWILLAYEFPELPTW